MNKLGLIGILFAVAALSACSSLTRSEQQPDLPLNPQLVAIDSLMQTRPDSALTCLLDAPLDDPYYQLLLSEALYKNDYEQANRLELLSAMAYYDSLCGGNDAGSVTPTNTFLSARCHYMNGVGYYEMDSVVLACAEYLKALEIMDDNFEKKDLVGKKAKFMAFIYLRLGDLFSANYFIESSIKCYHEALVFCRIEPTSKFGVSSILYNLGIQFDMAGQKDSADFYYNKALANMPEFDNARYRDIIASKAVLDFYSGHCLDSVIKDLKHVISLSEDEDERLTRYLTIGYILYESGKYDSSLFYLETVFEQGKDYESKILAAESLSKIYQSEGDSLKAQPYEYYLASFTMSEIEKKAVVSRADEMFRDYMNQKQEKETQNNAIKNTLYIILPIVLLIAWGIYFLLKHRSKKLLKKQQAEADKALEKEKKARQHEKEKLQQDIRLREEHINALKKTLIQQREEAELRRESFLKEPICCKINDSIRNLPITAREGSRKNVTLTEEDSTALREAVLKHYDSFETILLSKYPKLKQDDIQLCQLYLLGLDERQIAVLQCKTYSAIKKRANLLKDFLGIEDNLSIYILNFSNHPEK